MSPLSRKLLLVQQHLHKATPAGIGAASYAIGCFRLVTDEFAAVDNLVPVAPADPEQAARVTLYPDNVHTEPLYRSAPGASRLGKALAHARSVPRIARAVRRADIVYARWPGYPAFAAALLAVLLRKELMVSIHGDFSQVMVARHEGRTLWRATGRLIDAYQRAITRHSAVTMVTGEHTRRLAGRAAFVFAQHQFEDRHIFAREDTCTTRPIRLMYVGALSRNKGTDMLLDALAKVRARGMDCVATLVGLPSGFDIQAEISARGLEGAVDVTGYVDWGDDLFAIHRKSDIFVFPSLSEGVPKAPMEALSQGLPVIATEPGTSTYVHHEESALLVPVGDAAALAQAIERVVEDRALRRRLIAGGLEVARANTRDRIQARIRAILAQAFAEEPGAR